MKYTILGFSQSKAIELNLDMIDLMVLRYFIDFKDTEEMVMEIVNNKPYYWVQYDSIIKAIPIIGISNKIALRRRLKKLEDSGVLIHACIKCRGTYSYYGIGKRYKELVKITKESKEIEQFQGVKLKSLRGSTEKYQGVKLKSLTGSTEKFNQKINLLKDKSIKDKEIYSMVIDHLNNKTRSNYKSTTKDTQKLIDARLKDGYTELDFIKVIDIKSNEWKGTNFEKYLRPQTLFGNKFENYLNQKKGENYGSFEQNTKQSAEFDFSKLNEY